jgi:hypothetical protein
MNSFIKALLVSCFVFAMSGCATGPTYKNVSSPDAASISGHFANFIRYYSQGEAHVKIKEIDGVPTGRGGEYRVAPGVHELGIYAANDHTSIREYIKVEFPSGAKYKLVANLREISFHFRLLDVAGNKPQEVSTFKLTIGSVSAPPVIVPIAVPAH